VTRPQRTDAASSPGHPYLDDWRTFLQAHALISRRLDEELRAEQSMSLAEYDALVQLALAPERRLRMSQLADRVLLSRSGVTRLVDRLVAAGFVDRTQCTTDARGAEAVITELGLTRLRRASRTHLRGIDHYFIGPLSEDELGAIGRSLGTIVDVLRGGASTGGGGRSDETDEADPPADGQATTDEGRPVARRPKIESSEAAPV
jgi:DNA-binding MarR family transcriptional regulator